MAPSPVLAVTSASPAHMPCPAARFPLIPSDSFLFLLCPAGRQVGDMLSKRTRHQELQEYEEADTLHAALTEMGVVLDTRLKTWKRPAARERTRK